MNIRTSLFVLTCALGAAAHAENAGVQRAADGTVAAVTSPVKIVEGVQEESARNGPIAGAVVGTARGAVNAAGTAAEGGVNIGVGMFEATVGLVQQVFRPFTARQ